VAWKPYLTGPTPGDLPDMLIGLWIRDVVLIEALDLSIGPA
jgi:hypothetical protein